MIDFSIKKETIIALLKEGFYPDSLFIQYFILKCLSSDGKNSLILLDDSTSSKRLLVQYYELLRMGMVKESEEGFIITDYGKTFLSKIDPKDIKNDVEVWIDSWLELFPSGVKSGGKLLRSDKKGCITKMKKFIKEYPQFSKQDIMKATAAYLEERERENWNYCKCATYFISKMGEGSSLAEWCEEYSSKGSPSKKEIYVKSNLI